MSEKHRIFVEQMGKIGHEFPQYVEPLKTITKSYLITEGIADKLKSFGNKLVHHEPPKPEPLQANPYRISDTDRALLAKDRETFMNDYQMFQFDLKTLILHLQKFGDSAFMQFVTDPRYNFDRALRRGEYIDELHERAHVPSMLAEAVERTIMFDAVLESVAALGYAELAKTVHKTYSILESDMGISTRYIVESVFDDMDVLLEMVKTDTQRHDEEYANRGLLSTTLPRIASFIANHGKAAWDKFLASNAYQFAKKRAELVRKGERIGG